MQTTRALLAALALLTFASSASAECAWVLWENRYVGEARVILADWHPNQGYATAQQCGAAFNELRAQVPREFAYICLPDTVDPRGPKGRP
jgi:hypothetical protein